MPFGDPKRLYQTILNILTNAIKFTLDTWRISINCTILPGFVEITVPDTGKGIDEDVPQQIFEMFRFLGNVRLQFS